LAGPIYRLNIYLSRLAGDIKPVGRLYLGQVLGRVIGYLGINGYGCLASFKKMNDDINSLGLACQKTFVYKASR
jgi:hypothetical protein